MPSSETGEDSKNPFLEFVTLLDLGSGVNGFAKTAHGGFYGVVLDEVMGKRHRCKLVGSLSLSPT